MNLLSGAALAEITEAVARRLPQHVTKRLYTVQEAAEYMGCSAQQVRNWIAAGKLPIRGDGDQRPQHRERIQAIRHCERG